MHYDEPMPWWSVVIFIIAIVLLLLMVIYFFGADSSRGLVAARLPQLYL
jgi:hypothetical protein